MKCKVMHLKANYLVYLTLKHLMQQLMHTLFARYYYPFNLPAMPTKPRLPKGRIQEEGGSPFFVCKIQIL